MAAVSGFRRLLRSTSLAFRGDAYALSKAREQLKDEFRKNKSVKDADTLSQLLQGIQEVDEMLRFNIVQGARNARGNYEVKLHEQAEHQATIEAGQDRPHGVDIAPIDRSILGESRGVTVTVTKSGPSSNIGKPLSSL